MASLAGEGHSHPETVEYSGGVDEPDGGDHQQLQGEQGEVHVAEAEAVEQVAVWDVRE